MGNQQKQIKMNAKALKGHLNRLGTHRATDLAGFKTGFSPYQ